MFVFGSVPCECVPADRDGRRVASAATTRHQPGVVEDAGSSWLHPQSGMRADVDVVDHQLSLVQCHNIIVTQGYKPNSQLSALRGNPNLVKPYLNVDPRRGTAEGGDKKAESDVPLPYRRPHMKVCTHAFDRGGQWMSCRCLSGVCVVSCLA